MSAPLFGLGSIVIARAESRAGVVVGVFVDGSRAANHFRCFRCDSKGDEVDGVSDLLALHEGYTYLVADADGEFVVRETAAHLVKQAGPRVAAAATEGAPDALRDPTDAQGRYLRAVRELALQLGGDNVGLSELRLELHVRSLFAVKDQVERLERKGLLLRRSVGENGKRREVISLTEASERWLTKNR